MDAIIDFLLEYYVWVLVVLVILVITIIGFLVDNSRKKKMRKKLDSEIDTGNMSNGFSNVDMLNNPNMNLNMNMNQPINNGFNGGFAPPTDFNNNMAGQNMNLNQMAGNLGNSMPQSNNMNNNFSNNSDSFFTSISEQTPHFEPREVNIPSQVVPTPIMGNDSNMNFGINSSVAQPPKPVVEPVPVPNVISPVNTNLSVGAEVNSTGNVVGMNLAGGSSSLPNVNPVSSNQNVVNNNGYNAFSTGSFNQPISVPFQDSVVNQDSGYEQANTVLNGQPVVGVAPSITPQENVNYSNSATQGSSVLTNVQMPAQGVQTLANDISNQQQINNVNPSVPNSNLTLGGSTFVVGNPQPNNEQVNQNSGNWNM